MRAPVASRLRGAAPRARECGRGQEEEDGVVRLLLAKMPTGFFFFFFGTPIMSLSHLWLLQRTQRYNLQ